MIIRLKSFQMDTDKQRKKFSKLLQVTANQTEKQVKERRNIFRFVSTMLWELHTGTRVFSVFNGYQGKWKAQVHCVSPRSISAKRCLSM